jgi:hypothetical protein
VAKLRERGEFDPENLGHRGLAEREPLTVAERLEHMAIGEVLARHYRHPSMLDRAAKAGANWEQIGAARGTSADQARLDYREWAKGQHNLLSWTDGRFGMSDAEYAAALERSSAPARCGSPATCGEFGHEHPHADNAVSVPAPAPSSGAAKAHAAKHPLLCAHAHQDGDGSHWLEPGEKGAGFGQAIAPPDLEAGQ